MCCKFSFYVQFAVFLYLHVFCICFVVLYVLWTQWRCFYRNRRHEFPCVFLSSFEFWTAKNQWVMQYTLCRNILHPTSDGAALLSTNLTEFVSHPKPTTQSWDQQTTRALHTPVHFLQSSYPPKTPLKLCLSPDHMNQLEREEFQIETW